MCPLPSFIWHFYQYLWALNILVETRKERQGQSEALTTKMDRDKSSFPPMVRVHPQPPVPRATGSQRVATGQSCHYSAQLMRGERHIAFWLFPGGDGKLGSLLWGEPSAYHSDTNQASCRGYKDVWGMESRGMPLVTEDPRSNISTILSSSFVLWVYN